MVHIGEKIRKRFEEKVDEGSLTIGQFAEKIHRSRQNIYNIFKRPTIDTGLLVKISEVLEFDFFQYYWKESKNEKKHKDESYEWLFERVFKLLQEYKRKL